MLVSRVFLVINVFEINIEGEGKEQLASVSTIMTVNVAFSSLLPTMSFPVQIFSPASWSSPHTYLLIYLFILGGWLLVLNIVIKQIKDQDDLPQLLLETSYRKVDSYKSNNLVLNNSALNDLKTLMPFTQMRFHCRKPGGSTFHIVTTGNSTGEAVVQYFTGQTNTMPDSCGSYIKLWDDNSNLANLCADWGYENGNYDVGKWGHEGMRELYDHPAFTESAYHWVTFTRWECDDFKQSPHLPPNETFWKIFVR